MHRRKALRVLGAAGLLPLVGGAGRPTGRLERIGLQLYTVRDRMAADVDGTLAAVAEIGYREVEFAGTFGRPPAELRGTLDGLGLAAPSAHVPLEALLPDPAAAADVAATLGNRWLVVAWIPPGRRTLDDYRRFAGDFNRIGESLRAAGLRFAYHNHDFELARAGDVVPLELLIERTDPALVDFELDLYWVMKGGGDPLEYFARFPGRFPLIHAKDIGAAGEMVDVGRGLIDWERVISTERTAGIRHWYVEHDNPRPDSLASARASHAYLAHLAAG
jgi:sugar phosphate isomerase/epimerase